MVRLVVVLVFVGLPAFAQIQVKNGADIDMTGSTGSELIFPDGSKLGTKPDAIPTGHGGTGHLIQGSNAFVGGVSSNTVQSNHGVVAGGIDNVAGKLNPLALYATVGGGGSNDATADFATISGGYVNYASSTAATVSGGYGNSANGAYSTVGGGNGAAALADYSLVAGGRSNVSGMIYSAIGGGYSNYANGEAATIAGGNDNDATNDYATVAGAQSNQATAVGAAIAAGLDNTASGQKAFIAGGSLNEATGTTSLAAGYRAKAKSNGQMVFTDGSNFDFDYPVANSFMVRATGGVLLVTGINGRGVPTTGSQLNPGSSSWSGLSTKESKENYEDIDKVAVLDKLAALPIQRWNYKANDDAVKHIGPYAQDFHGAFGLNGAYDGRITTQDLDGIALAAIQGLNTKLEAEVAELREDNAALTVRLTELEAMVARLAAGE